MLIPNTGWIECNGCNKRLHDLKRGAERKDAQHRGWGWSVRGYETRDYCPDCFGEKTR